MRYDDGMKITFRLVQVDDEEERLIETELAEPDFDRTFHAFLNFMQASFGWDAIDVKSKSIDALANWEI